MRDERIKFALYVQAGVRFYILAYPAQNREPFKLGNCRIECDFSRIFP